MVLKILQCVQRWLQSVHLVFEIFEKVMADFILPYDWWVMVALIKGGGWLKTVQSQINRGLAHLLHGVIGSIRVH